MGEHRNETDRILGEQWMAPRHVLLVKALEAHPDRGLILELEQETDERGERRWSLCRKLEGDGWVEVWLRPWPLDPVGRAPSDQGRRSAGEGGRA